MCQQLHKDSPRTLYTAVDTGVLMSAIYKVPNKTVHIFQKLETTVDAYTPSCQRFNEIGEHLRDPKLIVSATGKPGLRDIRDRFKPREAHSRYGKVMHSDRENNKSGTLTPVGRYKVAMINMFPQSHQKYFDYCTKLAKHYQDSYLIWAINSELCLQITWILKFYIEDQVFEKTMVPYEDSRQQQTGKNTQ